MDRSSKAPGEDAKGARAEGAATPASPGSPGRKDLRPVSRDRFGEALDRAAVPGQGDAAAARPSQPLEPPSVLRVVDAQTEGRQLQAHDDRLAAALERAASGAEHAYTAGDDGREDAHSPGAVGGAYGDRRRIAYTRTKVLSVDPKRLDAVRVMVADADHWGLQASHKLLRTRVLQQMRANGWRTLGVVSARGNPGRTLVACNLAVGIAQEADLTALLIDADLRAPMVAGLFGLPPGPGFAGVVTGRATLEDALVHASIGEPGPELVILAGGPPVVGAAEIMGSPRVAGLVREIAKRYDDRMVVFDLPPVLAGADALAFLPNVDATLLVVEEYATTYEDLEQAQELLAEFNLLGVVLDKASDVAINRDHGRRPGFLARLVSRIGL